MYTVPVTCVTGFAKCAIRPVVHVTVLVTLLQLLRLLQSISHTLQPLLHM